MRTVNTIFLSLLLLVGACNDGGGDDQGTADAAIGDDGGPPPGSVTVTWGPVTVNPNIENTQCVTKRLGNAEQLRVGSITNALSATSHHFIVYRVADTVEQVDPYPCQPFADTLDPTNGAPLMITQRSTETLTLPQGVAFTLEANQMVRLEMHYINATSTAVEAMATSTFTPIAEDDFRDEAEFLFIGNPDVDVKANSTAILGPSYFPLPTDLADVSFFAITGHTHQWGTNVTVSTATSASDTGTPVYDVSPFLWDEPEVVAYDPGFKVPNGGGFRFTCEWNNMSNADVGFGESANEEMCFFWAYYYPSKGARVCFHTDQAGGVDACCPGSVLCSLLGQ